jgi:hypothetical protein
MLMAVVLLEWVEWIIKISNLYYPVPHYVGRDFFCCHSPEVFVTYKEPKESCHEKNLVVPVIDRPVGYQ